MTSLLARLTSRLHPVTLKRLQRFRQIQRGWYSFLLLLALMALSVGIEFLVGNRALVVRHEGSWYFPVVGALQTGRTFGLDFDYEVNYRQLRTQFREEGRGNFVLLPPIPYGPLENCYPGQAFLPRPPDWARGHLLGTDQLNRDILARLLHGMRISFAFSLSYVAVTFLIGITLGASMGYFGGLTDLIGQRLIEIWSLIPFLFIVIIVHSVIPRSIGMNLWVLLGIVVFFSWTSITYYLRTATYREKARDYVAAARVLGAGPVRIIFRHVLPNVLSTVITFLPFTMAAGITALTALDFLGFGLPPPTPSWGELLRQGTSNLQAPWIVASAFGALTLILTLVSFVGEAIREAFDPRKHTFYR